MSAGQRARIELNEHGVAEAGGWDADVERDAATARDLMKQARTVRQEISQREATLGNIVQQLRTMGASWSVIGAALGTSRAAAHKRYAGSELTR